MANEQFHEVKGKTSVGGKIVRFLFWGWQILMVIWLISYWGEIGHSLNSGSSAEQTGAAIGSAIGTGMLIFFWVAGTLILGIPMLLTRPQKYLVKSESGKPEIAS